MEEKYCFLVHLVKSQDYILIYLQCILMIQNYIAVIWSVMVFQVQQFGKTMCLT